MFVPQTSDVLDTSYFDARQEVKQFGVATVLSTENDLVLAYSTI